MSKRKDPMGEKDLMGEDMFCLLIALVFVVLQIKAEPDFRYTNILT